MITHLAVEPDGADATVGLEREKKIRAGWDDAAGDTAGGIAERELGVGGDAEVDDWLSVSFVLRPCGPVGPSQLSPGWCW